MPAMPSINPELIDEYIDQNYCNELAELKYQLKHLLWK